LTCKSSLSARQNHFPVNDALLSMRKSTFGRNFNRARKTSTKKTILKSKGPLSRNWMIVPKLRDDFGEPELRLIIVIRRQARWLYDE